MMTKLCQLSTDCSVVISQNCNCQNLQPFTSWTKILSQANKFILINSCDAIAQMRFSDRKYISVVHRLCCHRNFLHLHPSTLSNVQQNFAKITFMKKIHFHRMKTIIWLITRKDEN